MRTAIDGERPSDETIRRVLRSATVLGIVTHRSGSPYYWVDRLRAGFAAPTEIDVEDLISNVRTRTLVQHRPSNAQHILSDPSHGKHQWKAAFLTQFAEAEHIVIVDTATADLVDLAKHLDMDRFEPGTTCLDLEGLRETQLFDEILTELYQSHRPALDYRDIEEHVRMRVRTVDLDAPEWAEQVENIVDEVMKVVEPIDPREQSQISEWIRSTAKNEIHD